MKWTSGGTRWNSIGFKYQNTRLPCGHASCLPRANEKAICIYIFSKSLLIHVPQLTKKTWTLSVKWKVKLRRHHEIETLHHDLEILDGAQHFLLNKFLKIQRALPIKACDEIALCVLNLRRHWQLCLLCVYSSQSDSPSFILQFWLKTHWEGKKHRQVFLTFTTTKSGFGID